MLKRLSILLVVLCLPFTVSAADFVAGKDYEVITGVKQKSSKTIKVAEFFSYECPWCYRLEPSIEAWRKTKASDVEFQRVPVPINKTARIYSKVYYVAKGLNIADKINAPLFRAIHEENRDLTNLKALETFFAEHGVKKDDFDNAYNFSMTIDAEIAAGNDLVRKYKVYGIPTVVVDGKYKTDSRMTQGDAKKMIAVIDFLIKKARQEKKQ